MLRFGENRHINNPSQLDLFRDGSGRDEKPKDDYAELYTPEAIAEEQEREEEIINETLNRGDWERKKQDEEVEEASRHADYQSYLEWEENNWHRFVPSEPALPDIFSDKGPDDKVAIDPDEEADKPGYELYGRFSQYKNQYKTHPKGKK